MATVEDIAPSQPAPAQAAHLGIQPTAYLLELSPDWIVLRASENIFGLLNESHVTLIDEPLGRFVQNQALHDLRNLFSRLSGTTGIGRAYGVRLTKDPDLFDLAFQLSDGRVLLEACRAADSYGEAFGTVGGLIAGLDAIHGQGLLDGAARRMRALTGYDRVTFSCGNDRATSSRGQFSTDASIAADLPPLIADTEAQPIPIFPRRDQGTSAGDVLMRSPQPEQLQSLSAAGIRAAMSVPFQVDGTRGQFRCESRTPRAPSFELHAAAELFAQLFAMRLELDRLRVGA